MSKKLSLNKNTIANLGVKAVELDDVYGGVLGTYLPLKCPTPDSAICMVSRFDDCDDDSGNPLSCSPMTCY